MCHATLRTTITIIENKHLKFTGSRPFLPHVFLFYSALCFVILSCWEAGTMEMKYPIVSDNFDFR